MRIVYSLLLITGLLVAKTAKITYYENPVGQPEAKSAATIVVSDGNFAELYSDNGDIKLRDIIPVVKSYIDYTKKRYIRSAQIKNSGQIFYQADFDTNKVSGLTDDKIKYLGFECKKIQRSVNSNKIEIFYTDQAGVNGSPRLSMASVPGLILKIVINDNYEIRADKIEWLKSAVAIPANPGKEVAEKEFDKIVTKSIVTEIPVFSKEQISFGNEIKNPPENSSNQTFKYAGGTVILKKITLPEIANEDQIFLELTEKSKGDAYDRTGSVFIIPTGRKTSFLEALEKGVAVLPVFSGTNGKKYQGMLLTDSYQPLLELMRFFTPFGVGHFNRVNDQIEWQDSVLYKQEITHLKSALQGEIIIGVCVGNYDKGGHEVSLNLKYYPGSREISTETKTRDWILPLFNTVNIMEMAGQEYSTLFEKDSLTVSFEVPENVSNLKLYYTTTGHGGWGGGDEFNQKLNEIFIDDKPVFAYTPWRTDCGVYRSKNPASGNFWNGLSSSDLSRSGWCPGTATPPEVIVLKNLKAGKHQIKVAIPLGAPENGSFSAWNISGTLVGEYK